MSKETANFWLESALSDLKNIKYILADEFLTHVVAFHSQQCVEKCFKAIIELKCQKVPKEHSTLRLYGIIKGELTIDVNVDMLTDFDDLYINSRYPGDLGLLPNGKPTHKESQEFFEFAVKIYDYVAGISGYIAYS